MVGAGVVTTVPLLMFASSAQRIPLSTLGILQYINPTIAFLLGVFLFHEPFNLSLLIGFSIVWLALIIYWGESFLASRKARSLCPSPCQNPKPLTKSGPDSNYRIVLSISMCWFRKQTSEFLELGSFFPGLILITTIIGWPG